MGRQCVREPGGGPLGRGDPSLTERDALAELTVSDAMHTFPTSLELPGTWHLAPGTWHLAPGTWHLAPGTWHLAPGTWHLAPGTWHLASRPAARLLAVGAAAGGCGSC